MTGVDPSIKMLELARQRLGEGAALHQAGLGGAPLPFPDGAFDDAIVCLVLHYLEDWQAPLAELRRVLSSGGRLIVAVNRPFVYKLQYADADYFAPREYSEEYTFSGQNAELTYWHRPLHAMTSAFTEAGFRTTVISEPPPAPGAAADVEDPPPAHVPGQVKDSGPRVIAVEEIGLGLGRVRLGEAVVVVGHSLTSMPGRSLRIRMHRVNPGTSGLPGSHGLPARPSAGSREHRRLVQPGRAD